MLYNEITKLEGTKSMKKLNNFGLVLLVVALAVVSILFLMNVNDRGKVSEISSYEECVSAKHNVRELHPEKCVTRDGRVFTNTAVNPYSEPICVNNCGDGTCAEIVCMGSGCPCAESKESCPEDCGNLKGSNKEKTEKGVGIANPASVYCLNQGGSLSTKKDESAGGEISYCTINGKICEEWAYYRGECKLK